MLLLALLASCGETGQPRVSFPVSAVGTVPETVTVGTWEVTVTEARLAFGPLYLCSAQDPGLESCAHAAAEHLGASSFDALSTTPAPIGVMTGTTGVTILSGMWDYGRAWRLSGVEPRPLDGAIDGEHSLVLVVEAVDGVSRAQRTYRFVIDVDGGTQPSGNSAARGRLPAHELGADEPGLVVRFDPTLWASMLDFDALASLPEPSPGASIDVPETDPSTGALTFALSATGLPSFEWQP